MYQGGQLRKAVGYVAGLEQNRHAFVDGVGDKVAVAGYGRHGLQADVRVPAGNQSALFALSRPFFRGYRAAIDDQALVVSSYRGLIPLIEIQPGRAGRLTLVYRPSWLVWGGCIAAISLLVVLGSAASSVLSGGRGAQ